MSGCVGPGQEPGTQCGRKVKGHGLCNAHYQQQRKHPDRPLRPIGEHLKRADADTERLIREKYAEMLASGYEPSRKRSTPKPCPRGNDPVGSLRCVGVVVEGVKVIDPHDAPVDEFGHDGAACRKGWSRCRDRKCRTCMSVRENLRAAVRRARFSGMTDAQIRAATPSKRCPKCRQTFSSDEFGVDRSSADGLGSQCKRCTSAAVMRTRLPETRRAAKARRRARKRNAFRIEYSEQDLELRFGGKRGEWKCTFCNATDANTVEHWLPLSRYGVDYLEILVPACGSCNSSKRDRDPFTWIEPLLCRVVVHQDDKGNLVALELYRKEVLDDQISYDVEVIRAA